MADRNAEESDSLLLRPGISEFVGLGLSNAKIWIEMRERIGGMKRQDILQEISHHVRTRFAVEEVIFFGSSITDNCQDDSDIDMLVVTDDFTRRYLKASEIRLSLRRELGVNLPMDIMVRSPQEIAERRRDGDTFIETIVSQGMHS